MLVAGGATSVTTYFALRLAADGTAATGLTITNFDLQYVRSGAEPSVKADATALAATNSAHAANKAIEIDATDAPGLYRVDWPDAAFAAGVREVILTVKVATAFTEHLRCEIDGEVNVVEWAGTDVVAGAIPAAAADAAGGLPISIAGSLDLDAMNTNINDIETDTNALNDTKIPDTISLAAINAEVDSALDEPIPGVPTAGSVNDVLKDLDGILPGSTLSVLTAANVNSEVADVIRTDTSSLPAQGAPTATPTLDEAIMYLYKAWRNRVTQTATTYSLYADDTTTVDQKATVSDDATTFDKGEIATGP